MTLASFALVAVLVAVAVLGIAASAHIQRLRHPKPESGISREYELSVEQARPVYDRAARHAPGALEARGLSRLERARAIGDWRLIQSDFDDDPAGAVERADVLLTYIMGLSGFAVSRPGSRAEPAKDDCPVFAMYCDARSFARSFSSGNTAHEQLRQAFIRYKALFDDLVNEPPRSRPMVAASEQGATHLGKEPIRE